MNDAALARVFVFATDNLQDTNISSNNNGSRHEVTLMVLCKTKGLVCCVCHGQGTLSGAIVISFDTECSLICLLALFMDAWEENQIKVRTGHYSKDICFFGVTGPTNTDHLNESLSFKVASRQASPPPPKPTHTRTHLSSIYVEHFAQDI